MNYIAANTLKSLLLTTVVTLCFANDVKDVSGSPPVDPQLTEQLSQAAKRRQGTFRKYTKKTGMQHASMMLATDGEIEARYADDVAASTAADASKNPKKRQRRIETSEEESLDDTDVIVFGRGGVRAEKADGTEVILDDEPLGEPVAKRRLTQPRKVGMPKRKPSASVYKNHDIPVNMGGTITFYDSETTTLSPKCGGRFVELAAIKAIDGIPRETLHILFNPDMKSWDGAFKAHGLHESYLRAQAPFHKVAKYIEDFFGQDVRSAHNGFKFDDPYLNFELRRARVFWQFRQMISPDVDFKDSAPRTALLEEETVTKGHELLKELGIVTESSTHENLDAKANSLAAAAMLYFFKDHMNQLELGLNDDKKPGPMMYLDGNMLPDPEVYPQNHEAAVARLAWFRLIRQDTDTSEQRAQLKQPYAKYMRDAIQTAEVYLLATYRMFQDSILDEVAFQANPVDVKQMFDTLVYVRSHQDQFTKSIHIDNHKLDSVIDYYGLNRHARETGTHGAAIDTSLLFQVARKLLGASDTEDVTNLLSKNQVELEEYLFAKNSIQYFDEHGKLVSSALLHDDQIKGTTRDRNGRRAEPGAASSAVPSYASLMTAQTMPAAAAIPSATVTPNMPPMMPQFAMPQYGYPYGVGQMSYPPMMGYSGAMVPPQMSYPPMMPPYMGYSGQMPPQQMSYPPMMPGYPLPQGMPPSSYGRS